MSTSQVPKSHIEIVELYRETFGDEPATAAEMAAWAVNEGHWEMPFTASVKQCAKELAEAMRTETYTDPQGRKNVRRWIAARTPVKDENGKTAQKYLWDQATECTEEFAHRSARQMHKAIGKDCKALHDTCESMNANNPNLEDNPIQLSWDFMDFIKNEDDSEDVDPRKPR